MSTVPSARAGSVAAGLSAPTWLAGVVLLVGAAVAPLILGGGYVLNLLTLVCIYVTLTVSYNLIVGYTGYLTLAHNTFFGIGTYASAISLVSFGQPPIVGILLGLLISGIVSGLSGWLLFSRLRGFTFSMVTLGLAVTSYIVVTNWIDFTRGPLGIPGVLPRPVEIASLRINLLDPLTYYFVGLVLVVAAVLISTWIGSSRAGRALLAIRENERLAEACGVNALQYKLLVFISGSMIASLAGAYYVYFIKVADPEVFWTYWLTGLLSMLIVGGPGRRTIGIILAATALVIVPELLRFAQGLRQLIYGSALLAIVIFLPVGLGGLIERVTYRRRLRRWRTSAGGP